MDILKDFFSKFVVLILIIGCIIFISGDEPDITSNQDDKTNNIVNIDTNNNTNNNTDNKEVKKGSFISEPKQEKISQETVKVDVGGIKVNITKLAKYDITGVVMDTEHYSDVVGPIDVALAWGKLAEDSNYKGLTSYVVRNRSLTWKSNDSKWIEKMGGADGVTKNCSNNHLIPSNENIRKEILKIDKDDYIRLTGYLVKAEWNVGNTRHVWGPSSLKRTDTGNNACEIMYVQTINFL